MTESQHSTDSSFSRWLPYVIGCIGFFSTFVLWLSMLYTSVEIVHYKDFIPWIVLLLCILMGGLLAISFKLIRSVQKRSKILDSINQDLKQEIIAHQLVQETKQNLEKALLQGQKLQAIGTLAGGIAHDFNNILYAIIGYLEMSRDDVKKDSITHRNLGKAIEAANRGQELISRILAFSRRQHNELKPIPLKATAENVLSLLKPAIPSSVTINYIPIENDCIILGDPTGLHQVIVNLINNAVDAMNGEGIVTVKLSILEPDHDLLKQIPPMTHTQFCKIEIADTGYGMDPNTMERIFEPFFTTKEVGRGTGLGLSTVHKIISEHHGNITVKSQLGQGTTFTILLPRIQGE